MDLTTDLSLLAYAGIFIAGVLGWIFSSLAAGGGALLSVPLLNALLPLNMVAPILCTGSVIGSFHRAWLYRKQVNWQILAWLMPGIISGALLGSWLFSRLSIPWLSALVALFLIGNGLSHYLWPGKASFTMRLPYFSAAGFITAVLSAVIGAVGPILNPFYLNYGADKEEMLGTKAVSSCVMQLAKLVGYFYFLEQAQFWLMMGLILGGGAIIGNRIGKKLLEQISKQQFKHIANGLLIISGGLMLL